MFQNVNYTYHDAIVIGTIRAILLLSTDVRFVSLIESVKKIDKKILMPKNCQSGLHSIEFHI